VLTIELMYDAAAFGPEVLERLLDGQDRAKNVGVEVPAELGLGDRLDRPEPVDPGRH
jgi:hypothetical protein